MKWSFGLCFMLFSWQAGLAPFMSCLIGLTLVYLTSRRR